MHIPGVTGGAGVVGGAGVIDVVGEGGDRRGRRDLAVGRGACDRDLRRIAVDRTNDGDDLIHRTCFVVGGREVRRDNNRGDEQIGSEQGSHRDGSLGLPIEARRCCAIFGRK